MIIFKKKRKFYVKVDNKYLTKLKPYEWFAHESEWTKNILDAGKYTDSMYDNIKNELPKNHTLELVK